MPAESLEIIHNVPHASFCSKELVQLWSTILHLLVDIVEESRMKLSDIENNLLRGSCSSGLFLIREAHL